MNQYREIYAGFTAQSWKTDYPVCRGQGQQTHGNPVTIRSLEKGLEVI